jgi:hypothetical protein
LEFSEKEKVTCLSSQERMVGFRLTLHIHQMFGIKLSLEFIASNFICRLLNHLLGKLSKLIIGSEMKIKPGLCLRTSLLRTNRVRELAIPLEFHERHFIGKVWVEQPFWTWFGMIL